MVVDQFRNSHFAVIISGLVLISSLLHEMFSYATIFNGNNDGSFTKLLLASTSFSQNKLSFSVHTPLKGIDIMHMGSNFEMVFLYQISSEQNKGPSIYFCNYLFVDSVLFPIFNIGSIFKKFFSEIGLHFKGKNQEESSFLEFAIL